VAEARDAGMSLAFFSGNEMYWRIRWEEDISEAMSGEGGQRKTSHRTMVIYKDTSSLGKLEWLLVSPPRLVPE
jgi:hypothetical protein